MLRTRRADDAAWTGDAAPGTVVATAPALVVATGGGALVLAEVQAEGRPKMDGGAFARGALAVGERLG